MRNNFAHFLFFWLSIHSASAQSVISGQVSDADGNPLSGISVTLQPHNGLTIVAFDITDKDGKFFITYKSAHDSVLIKVYGLGWKLQEKQLGNRSQELVIHLTSKPILLKEVTIKPPIIKRGDTLSYVVQEFKNQSDRSIADVIRKLPGVEIEADGRILYQGKPINKYYIEGLDLLENKYRLANDNLPADAVAQVQIIENHQPIRMLDSLVFSNRAALNIKLRGNVAATGTAHAGTGGIPFLWDANVTPMVFTRNNQLIASWQSNNTGNDVSRQLKNISPGTVFNPLQNDDEKKDWLAIQPLVTPSFDEKRWLINNVHIGTINYLKKLTSNLEIRLNMSYVNDYQQQRGNMATTYYTAEDTIHISEKIYNQLFFNSLEANLTIQKNNTKKYIKNELSAKGNWNGQQGSILSNNFPLNQNLDNSFFWVKNNLTDLFKIGRHIITLQSTTLLNRTPQSLFIIPGQFADLINKGKAYDIIKQNVLATSFETDNSIGLTKKIKEFSVISTLGLEIEKRKLESNINYSYGGIERLLDRSFMNQLDWFKLNAYLRLKTQYRKGQWRLELDSPLNYYRFIISDTLLTKNEHLERLVLEPGVSVNYEINSLWTVSSNTAYRNRFGEVDDIYHGYLLKNYRTIQRNDVPVQSNKSVFSTIGLNYRNPLTYIFGSLLYSYSTSRNNLLYRSHITTQGALDYEAIPQPNYSYTQMINGQISMYLTPIKSNARLKMSWSTMARDQMINGSLLTVHNQTSSPELDLSTNLGELISIQYNYRLSFFRTHFTESNFQITSQKKHLLKINIYPASNSLLSIDNEYYTTDFTTSSTRNFFTNIVFRFTTIKKKVDFETTWSNVWNTKSITTGLFTSFSYIESVYDLRPMQVTQKIRFSF